MTRDFTIIEAPFNLGLKANNPDHAPGVYKLPKWLKQHGFHARLNPVEIQVVDSPSYLSKVDPESGIRNCDSVAAYSKKLAKAVYRALSSNRFPVVIGGDCSILIGCALAAKMRGDFGLFFIDGHTDFIPPELSQTKAAAGMDLYLVTGYGHPKLSDINGLRPYFDQKHVLAFGNRYDDEAYIDCIRASGIDFWDLSQIRQSGTDSIVRRYLKNLRQRAVDGFWIHLDVDVLHNDLMPAVDSPQAGGLNYEELIETLAALLNSSLTMGISITILDPDLDGTGKITELFVSKILPLFRK